ncbi:MAG TPA: hypothetical protein VFR05_00810 [Terriglobia bacterium]|nr:hypothetical protein [Terriglobia bacterium]
MSRLPLIRRALVLVVFFLALSTDGSAQTTPGGRQLLDAMLTALGGEKFLSVREIQMSGRYYMFARGEISQSDVYTSYLKYPDMDRIEFGKDKIKPARINRGLEGWTISPPKKGKDPDVAPTSIADNEEFLKVFRTSFNYMVRFVVNTPKASVISTGSETVDLRRADILEIRDAEKNLLRVFVDRETRLPIKTQTRLANEQFMDERVYANWHRFDGVMTPLRVIQYRDGVKTQEMFVDTAAYNKGIPDSLFAPPEKTK